MPEYDFKLVHRKKLLRPVKKRFCMAYISCRSAVCSDSGFRPIEQIANLRNDPIMDPDEVWIHGRPGKRCRLVPIQTENPGNRTSYRRKMQYTIMGIHRNELSGWRDLNPRPLRPERSALPGCATPRSQTLTRSGPPGSTTIPLRWRN